MVGKSKLSPRGARICAWIGRGCVLAAGAGAAFVLLGSTPDPAPTPAPTPAPGSSTTPIDPSASTAGTTNTAQATATKAFADFDLISVQLAPWDGPAPVVASTDNPDTPSTTPTASRGGPAYLGIITMGERKRALMFMDGRQRFMREGQAVGNITLTSIASDHVMLREGRTERRVDRQQAPSDRLGYLSNNPSPPRLASPDDFGSLSGDPSEQRRQEIARRTREGSRPAPMLPNGVPAAKARNLPNVGSDGQEGP